MIGKSDKNIPFLQQVTREHPRGGYCGIGPAYRRHVRSAWTVDKEQMHGSPEQK